MRKYIYLLLIVLFMPLMVNATNANSSVYYGKNVAVCTSSNYQSKSINTDGATYFSHCMESTCNNNKATLHYYNNNGVKCTNGNNSPYVKIVNDTACKKITSKSCNEVEYCSMILYYDCDKKSDGTSFKTTTTSTTTKRIITNTPKTTVVNTTNVVTTTVKESDTRLQSLTLSKGTISFNKDIYEYDVVFTENINNVDITAIPMESDSSVSIEGNTDITDGSVIKITVKGTDGKESIYIINIKINIIVSLSNNAYLKTLKIKNHEFAFNSNINNYTIYIDSNEKELEIYDYEPTDARAIVRINNNSNLTNGSKVEIVVTAEDGETVNTYTLDLVVKKKSSFLKVLFIIILILAILAGAYYLYQKLVLRKSGDKYEYE